MSTSTAETVVENRLSNNERETLIAQLERDGVVILPRKLPQDLMEKSIAAIDRIAHDARQENPDQRSVKKANCVTLDPAFMELMMYEPALQLAYDVFGPMFHLCQSNMVWRPSEDKVQREDFVSSAPWHADGPRPRLFPRVPSTHGPAMGLHYLKFGYFLTDLTHGNGGSLQVVRGSHLHDELDGDRATFDINSYSDDLMQIDCEAGTVVAFHQAQWHAAPPNQSDIVRKNLYISYCPTWMRPFDREFPTQELLADYSAEESWLLGEPRPSTRWWLPTSQDIRRMTRFKRDGEDDETSSLNYE